MGHRTNPLRRALGNRTRRRQARDRPDIFDPGGNGALTFVELTTDADNAASQRVILANGGRLVGPFRKLEAHGGAEGLRFRIELAAR